MTRRELRQPRAKTGGQRSEPGSGAASPRAQSEVVGVTILTGVVVIAALTVGAVIIAQTGGDDGPTTDLVLEVTASDVALTHNGGDTLALGDLTVVLDADGSERRFTPDAANTSDGDARLRPGDRISRAHGFPSDDLGVMVVHDPSNSVLVDDRERIPA
ncbi:hypothetical protein BRC95_06755 [Halobacteriales archaeon QS_5_68_33]|nr:MAG: hypothetical protein BRC95_06755 [Halobacteriales archaeon QS_5_68_33]